MTPVRIVATRLALLAGVYLLVCAAGGACVTDAALHRPRVLLTQGDTRHAEELAASLGARLDMVAIVAADAVTLHGWLVSPERASGSAVLLLHGSVSNRASMLEAATPFVEDGHRALIVDLRAGGESGGAIGTFGAREADDTRRWIAWLRRQNGEGCVYTFGGSLGAAIAIQAADAPGVCAAIADSGFTSLRDVAADRIGQRLGAGHWLGHAVLGPGVELGFLYARARYGVDLGQASALDAAARSGAPIFVIHGLEDDNSPPRNAQRLAQANPARVTLWLVPGAGHGQTRQVAGDAYPARVRAFLAAHRRPND